MKLSGIAAWGFFHKPKPAGKTKQGKIIPSIYTVNLLLEDVAKAKELKEQGFNIKKVTDEIPGIPDAVGMPYLQIKKAAEYDGTPTSPIEVVDAKLQPVTDLVGNGSKINVIFATSEWEAMGRSGIAAKLRKVQVVDLVPYEGGGALESFEEEEGYSTGTKAATSSDLPFQADDEFEF